MRGLLTFTSSGVLSAEAQASGVILDEAFVQLFRGTSWWPAANQASWAQAPLSTSSETPRQDASTEAPTSSVSTTEVDSWPTDPSLAPSIAIHGEQGLNLGCPDTSRVVATLVDGADTAGVSPSSTAGESQRPSKSCQSPEGGHILSSSLHSDPSSPEHPEDLLRQGSPQATPLGFSAGQEASLVGVPEASPRERPSFSIHSTAAIHGQDSFQGLSMERSQLNDVHGDSPGRGNPGGWLWVKGPPVAEGSSVMRESSRSSTSLGGSEVATGTPSSSLSATDQPCAKALSHDPGQVGEGTVQTVNKLVETPGKGTAQGQVANGEAVSEGSSERFSELTAEGHAMKEGSTSSTLVASGSAGAQEEGSTGSVSWAVHEQQLADTAEAQDPVGGSACVGVSTATVENAPAAAPAAETQLAAKDDSVGGDAGRQVQHIVIGGEAEVQSPSMKTKSTRKRRKGHQYREAARQQQPESLHETTSSWQRSPDRLSPGQGELRNTISWSIENAQNYLELYALVQSYKDQLLTGQVVQALARAARIQGKNRQDPAQTPYFNSLLAVLTKTLGEKITEMSPEHGVSVLNSYARLWLKPSPSDFLDPLCDQLVSSLSQRSNPNRTVLLVWSLAKLQHHHHNAFAMAAEYLTLHADVLSPRLISQVCWAFGVVQHYDWPMLNAISRATLMRVHDFDAGNFTGVVWGLARLKHYDDILYEALGEEAEGKLHTFEARNLSVCLWGFATLRYASKSFYTSAAKRCIELISDFAFKNVSNIAWAYAVRRQWNHELFEALAKRALEVIDEAQPQNLSNLVFAFARQGHHHEDLMRKVCDRSLELLDRFTAQNLSNMSWGMASLGHLNPNLMAAIAQTVEGHMSSPVTMSDYQFQNFSDLAWAFSTLGVRHQGMFDALAPVCIERLYEFSPHGLSDLIWAYTVADHPQSSEILSQGLAELTKKSSNLAMDSLARVLWACAKIGQCSEEFLSMAVDLLRSRFYFLVNSPENQQMVLTSLQALGWPKEEIEELTRLMGGEDDYQGQREHHDDDYAAREDPDLSVAAIYSHTEV